MPGETSVVTIVCNEIYHFAATAAEPDKPVNYTNFKLILGNRLAWIRIQHPTKLSILMGYLVKSSDRHAV